jgi:hypothetical protein
MKEALLAQMQQLTGVGGGYDEIYNKALGYEGGDLGDILQNVESPIRQKAAQVDTDVMRQTLMGDSTDARSIRYDDQGRAVKGTEDVGYRIVREGTGTFLDPSVNSGSLTISIVDAKGKVLATGKDGSSYSNNGQRASHIADDIDGAYKALLADVESNKEKFPILEEAGSTLKRNHAKSGRSYVMGLAEGGTLETGTVNSGKDLYKVMDEEMVSQPVYEKDQFGETLIDATKAGQTVDIAATRTGDGMIDLVGDSRAVQEQTQSEDYESYVRNDDARMANWEADNAQRAKQGVVQRTIEEWGQAHYEERGKAAGDEMPTSYSLQDAGRQAGFNKQNEFMGLSALSEDIGRGGQQRAREADIADVERLGGRATDAYRAQGDLSGALATARNMGAGGSDMESAIPVDNLFGVPNPLKSLGARTALENAKIDAITSGGVGALKARGATPLTAETGYTPSASISGGRMGDYDTTSAQGFPTGGTDAFRSALMQEGMGALDQGLSERENRAVQEAARARSTNMGRTFDQTASIEESRAVIEEDNARRMQNRAFAQSALGQEVGIQQADMGRGLQASLANQQATNQAAQFGVGAGLQQEQLGAQMGQQVNLAEFAQASDAAQYSAQEKMQAQQMELGRQSAGVDRQLTAEEKDIERIMRQQAMEEQYRQQGLGAERANAAQMVGLEQATSADPFQAILQRQGQNNLASGGAVFGQAGYGLDSGPQYLNPESGLGFIQNQATNAANMYGAQQMAGATKTGGIMGGIGSLAGGLLGNPNLFKCWVAREVYGEHNPAWLLFRKWLDTDAPRWFDKLYLTFGERFANFISNKPRLKARIRLWMDTKIGR